MAIKKMTEGMKREQLAVLRLEIDYHLLTLFEAMEAKDKKEIAKQKRILADKKVEKERLEHKS